MLIRHREARRSTGFDQQLLDLDAGGKLVLEKVSEMLRFGWVPHGTPGIDRVNGGENYIFTSQTGCGGDRYVIEIEMSKTSASLSYFKFLRIQRL